MKQHSAVRILPVSPIDRRVFLLLIVMSSRSGSVNREHHQKSRKHNNPRVSASVFHDSCCTCEKIGKHLLALLTFRKICIWDKSALTQLLFPSSCSSLITLSTSRWTSERHHLPSGCFVSHWQAPFLFSSVMYSRIVEHPLF